ncbi:MAG: type IX secretion system sortase PorU [Muribaculaceae bacterium]
MAHMKMSAYRILSILTAIVFSAFITAEALSSSHFATTSKLADGRWVKIRVSKTGITQIGATELQQWGFTDPQAVKVFGYGGKSLPEVLTDDLPDDLTQVATSTYADKVLFYAVAGRNATLNDSADNIRYLPDNNPYSDFGHYFITDSDVYPSISVAQHTNPNSGTDIVDYSYDYTLHETDVVNPGSTGRIFLGEEFSSDLTATFRLPTAYIIDTIPAILTAAVAYRGSTAAILKAVVNGENIKFSSSSSLMPSTSEYQYYSYAAPCGRFVTTSDSDTTTVTLRLSNSGGITTLAKLDYLALSFYRTNRLDEATPQIRIALPSVAATTKIKIHGTDNSTRVWDVSDPQSPVEYVIEHDSPTSATFTPGQSISERLFVAFNPYRQFPEAEYVGTVSNQDLHGIGTPDMLIITSAEFIEQAERLADIHRLCDGLEVAVTDHRLIFNEFSSGTPDASAYRLFAKMLYDRNPQKLKHILLFGTGSFDNRKAMDNPDSNLLITYQSQESTFETKSYTTDDFFVHLADNADPETASDTCCVAIGRMPVVTTAEAKAAVTKLERYLANSDRHPWRNEMLLFCDQGDNNLHTWQLNGIHRLLADTLGVKSHVYKLFNEDYPKDINGYAGEARRQLKSYLKSGISFASYIGHGGAEALTQGYKLFTADDARNTSYDNIPLITFATCNVARFDSGTRGIAEEFFHKEDGGAIACLASSRAVYAQYNNILNAGFIRALFSSDKITIGQATMIAKNAISAENLNSKNFLLLGDPALRLRHIEPVAVLDSIGHSIPDEATIRPMERAMFNGHIADTDGNIDTSFNGTAYITIFDAPRHYGELTYSSGAFSETFTPVLTNDKLCEFAAPVNQGRFAVECIAPINSKANGKKCVVSIFASTDSRMANALYDNVTLDSYLPGNAIVDTTAPEITAMGVGSLDFADGDVIHVQPVLLAEITDSVALSSQPQSIGQSCSVIVDGNTPIANAAQAIVFSADTRSASLELPLDNISYGRHTVTINVSDAAANHAHRTISFIYSPPQTTYDIAVEQYPARDKATFTISTEPNNVLTQATIRVTDSLRRTVWKSTTTNQAIEWDLTDSEGNRVAPGEYYFHVSANGSKGYGSSPTKKIIVVKQ